MRDCARLVTALHSPHPEERAVARVSKDGRYLTLMVRDGASAPPHHEGSELKRRQASRFRPARKRVVERCDLVPAEYELAGRGVVGGMLRRRGFWYREHRRRAGQESQRD